MQTLRGFRDSGLTLAVVVALSCAARDAAATTYFGFALGTADAPPAPTFAFAGTPRIAVVPNTRVSRLLEARDQDVFRFGGTWYAYSKNFWYRAAQLEGPYHVVDVTLVPRAVLFVPPAWWKHHPQGMAYGPPRGSAAAARQTPKSRAPAAKVVATKHATVAGSKTTPAASHSRVAVLQGPGGR